MFGWFELAALLRLPQLNCLFVGHLVHGWKLCCMVFSYLLCICLEPGSAWGRLATCMALSAGLKSVFYILADASMDSFYG